MKQACLAAVLLVGVSVQAQATEFEGLKWGTPPATVFKKYPGGAKGTAKNGGQTYGVVLPMAGRDALVSFTFSQRDALQSVDVIFFKRGAKFDVTQNIYTEETPDEAKGTFKEVRETLIAKYGQPMQPSRKEDLSLDTAVWPSGLMVFWKEEKGQPGRATCSVAYYPVEAPPLSGP